jgi:succinate dehydrogenase/fumarate reductase flavoprotein subunit
MDCITVDVLIIGMGEACRMAVLNAFDADLSLKILILCEWNNSGISGR